MCIMSECRKLVRKKYETKWQIRNGNAQIIVQKDGVRLGHKMYQDEPKESQVSNMKIPKKKKNELWDI